MTSLADELVEKAVWIIGGDGWAYDIGYGGLDHVLSSGRNVNILVLDTEVYSNTGGQASKAPCVVRRRSSPRPASPARRRTSASRAVVRRCVYVAQVSIGANQQQTVRALLEAQAWPGRRSSSPTATCIAHGIEMSTSMAHQEQAVPSGYWPLYRFRPSGTRAPPVPPRLQGPDHQGQGLHDGRDPVLDAHPGQPERASRLMALAQADADERWHYYRRWPVERVIVMGIRACRYRHRW